MCLVRNAAWVNSVIQRQTAFLTIVHPHIDLRQFLFVPVISPFQLPNIFAVRRNAGDIIGQIFRLLFVPHPVTEEQLHIFLPERFKHFAAFFVIQIPIFSGFMCFCIIVNVVHDITFTEHILRRCQHFTAVFRKIALYGLRYPKLFADLLKHI